MQAEDIYAVDGLPKEWGGVVARFVQSHAVSDEAKTGREGEYLRALNGSGSNDQFILHAKLYSQALWNWSSGNAPKRVLDWALGEIRDEIGHDTSLRLNYLLFRCEQMAWWNVRGRLDQTDGNIRRNALRFRSSLPGFLVASELDDIQLFEDLVTEKRQTRPNKRVYDMDYFVIVYWMAWSLWEEGVSLDDMVSIFFRRLGLNFGRSRLGELIVEMGLRSPAG